MVPPDPLLPASPTPSTRGQASSPCAFSSPSLLSFPCLVSVTSFVSFPPFIAIILYFLPYFRNGSLDLNPDVGFQSVLCMLSIKFFELWSIWMRFQLSMACHIAWYFNGIVWTLNDSIDFRAKKIIICIKFLWTLRLSRILSMEYIFSIPLCDLQVIVKPKIFLTIPWEEVLILHITNKPILLVLFHGILVYTHNSVYIFQIPGGKYVIDIFSDDGATGSEVRGKLICLHVQIKLWSLAKSVLSDDGVVNSKQCTRRALIN